MPDELNYSEQDKKDAKDVMEWLEKTHQPPERSVEHAMDFVPHFIKSAIMRLTFRHMDIRVVDLMETMKRIQDA